MTVNIMNLYMTSIGVPVVTTGKVEQRNCNFYSNVLISTHFHQKSAKGRGQFVQCWHSCVIFGTSVHPEVTACTSNQSRKLVRVALLVSVSCLPVQEYQFHDFLGLGDLPFTCTTL